MHRATLTIKAVLLAAFCLLTSWSMAQEPAAGEEDTITWMQGDFPPLRIIEGPFAGQGPVDMVESLMQHELSGYSHKTVIANTARTLEEIKNGNHVLAVGLIPCPKRQQIALFSLPCGLTTAIALITRQEDLGKLPEKISLREFLQERRLGISRSRSYGSVLDAVLEDFKEHDKLFLDSSDKLTANLIRMLLLGRIDGVLGYPSEAVYHARINGLADRIAVVPLTEKNQYILSRIAAPKTAWGAAMIARVNEILLRKRSDPSYREAFTRWLPSKFTLSSTGSTNRSS